MASGNAVLATANGLPLFEQGKLSGVTGKGGAKAKQVVSLMETTCFTSEDNLFCGGKQVISDMETTCFGCGFRPGR